MRKSILLLQALSLACNAGRLVAQGKSVRYLVEQQSFQEALRRSQLEVVLHIKQQGQLNPVGLGTVALQQLLHNEAVELAVSDADGREALKLGLVCTPQIPWASFTKRKVFVLGWPALVLVCSGVSKQQLLT